MTLRQAIKLLAEDGIVEVQEGRDTLLFHKQMPNTLQVWINLSIHLIQILLSSRILCHQLIIVLI